MAAWSDTTKHLPSSINSGNQYTVNDQVAVEALNNTVENAFYAVRVAENAQAVTNNGVSYDPQSATTEEKAQARANMGIITLPLGSIISTAFVTNEAGLHLLDGSSLAQDGIYSEFCNFIKERIAADPSSVPTCAIAEYVMSMSQYGQCGKFVINDTNSDITAGGYTVLANSIKLPTITEFIASNNGGQRIGFAQLDTFKSHNHYSFVTDEGYHYLYYGNSAADSTTNNHKKLLGADHHAGVISASGEVYTSDTGDTETRPKNIRYPYYIVVASGVKTDAEVDIDNIASDLGNKADKDAGNLSSANIENWASRCSFERVKVIYDRHSIASSVNLGYPDGIPPQTNVVIGDMTQYKFIRIYYVCYNHTTNDVGCTSNICEMSMAENINGIYFADAVTSLFANSSLQSTQFANRFQYFSGNRTIAYYPFHSGTLQTSSNYFITKIEGVK